MEKREVMQFIYLQWLIGNGFKNANKHFDKDDLKILSDIINQLLASVGFDVFGSWGVSEMFPSWFEGDKNLSLVLKVNGRLFSGDVAIVYYDVTDRYDIYLNDELVSEDETNDTFGHTIDFLIESGADPEEYEDFLEEYLGL